MNKKAFIFLIVWDCILISCSLFSTLSSLMNFYFMVNVERASSAPYFFTFTGLSNLFVGLVAVICLVFRLIKKSPELPLWLFIIKMSSISMITITMLTTICYLAPSMASSWWILFVNSNLFNHLLTPILAIVGFMVFEQRMNFKFPLILYTLVPLGIYAIIYLIRAVPHYHPNEPVNLYYDIYGLTRLGIGFLLLFFLLFALIGFLISTGLYFENRAKRNN